MKVLFCWVAGTNSQLDLTHERQLNDLLKALPDVDIISGYSVGEECSAVQSYPANGITTNGRKSNDVDDTNISRFAEEVAEAVRTTAYDVVLTLGVDLTAEILKLNDLAGLVWGVLSAADVSRATEGNQVASLDQIVRDAVRIVAFDNKVQRTVRRAVPEFIHRVITMNECASENALNLATADRRVLVYVGPRVDDPHGARRGFELARSLASDRVHAVLLCHNAKSVLAPSLAAETPHVSIIEPASATHQVDGAELLPRFAAWHISLAAADLECAVVVIDDLEAVEYSFSNDQLKRKVWPIIDFDDFNEFTSSAATYERIAGSVPRIVYLSEDCRAVVESRVPGATSKGVLLSDPSATSKEGNSAHNGAAFEKYLDRFQPDYSTVPRDEAGRRVLLAGHDFKFSGELIDVLSQRNDIELRVDHWKAQNIQDEGKSKTLRDWADIVLCEFASHNAVWYSWNKLPGQTLIVRFHGYELFSKWIQDINIDNVDKFVFVSEFYMEKVCSELNWPIEKAVVLPNVVDALDLNRIKSADARFHIGIAGIVPILKRPDRAVDLIERLLDADSRYVLHIRGRAPWEYGWMWENEEIREAYDAVYERIASNPELRRRIAFDEFGPDMGRWFQNIGWMLSPSFRETFHLAPVEGMASGAIPVVWAREGAVEIFGPEWVHDDTGAAVDYILAGNRSEESFAEKSLKASLHAQKYDLLSNGREWLKLLFSTVPGHSDVPSLNISVAAMEARFTENPVPASLTKLLSVLHRDGDLARIAELAKAHPELVTDPALKYLAAQRWISGVEALRANPPFIPTRSKGAAFLVEQGTVLLAVNEFSESSLRGDWSGDLLESVGKGKTSVVSVVSAAINKAFYGTSHGRKTIDVGGLPVTRIPLQNSDGLLLPQFIIAAADAIVREARATRPAAIASQSEFWVAYPALLASRRLGIPLMVADQSLEEEAALSRICIDEADSVFAAGTSPVESLAQAARAYELSTVEADQRQLKELRVGVIADNFTSTTIAHSFQTFALSREDGYIEVASLDLDAIFVESAWEGPNNQWRRGVAYYPDEIKDLEKIVRVAKARQIPVIFWNKEDPVHFRAFERTAKMMDHVFTTDADMVGKYLQSEDTKCQTASSLPFYAEPAIHNPLPTDRAYMHTVSYAGTYYGDRFKDRSVELHRILDAAKVHGLTIYDRQVNVPNSPYHFPPELVPFVREGVPYEEVLKVYKAHPVNINVNSANDSPTMFSRRVVEIAASGSLVLSGRGRGITEQIRGIEATDSDARWAELLSDWMSDETRRVDAVWTQMRTITRSHLAEHALTIVMRTAGIPVIARQLPSYALAASNLGTEDVKAILRQSLRPRIVYTEAIGTEDRDALAAGGVSVAPETEIGEVAEAWIAPWADVPSDTYFEDILQATRFGSYSSLSGRRYRAEDGVGQPIIELDNSGEYPELHRVPGGMNFETAPLTWVLPRHALSTITK